MSPSGYLSPSESCIWRRGKTQDWRPERERAVWRMVGRTVLCTGRARVPSTGGEVVRVGTGQKRER